MKLRYFMIITGVALSLILTIFIFTVLLGIQHTNVIYFWIMLYAYGIGVYLITRGSKKQVEKMEALVRAEYEELMKEKDK